MSLISFLADDKAIQDLESETSLAKKAQKGLRQYVPLEVTSFYLTVFALAGGQTREVETFTRLFLLPILGLIATAALATARNIKKEPSATKWWKRTKWWGVAVSTVAFIAWVYVSGGTFFGWYLHSFYVGVGFLFFGILSPLFYGVTTKKPEPEEPEEPS